MTGWSWEAMLAGAALAAGGALLAMLRSVPTALWERAKEQVCVTADVVGGDAAFEWLRLWLVRHEYSQRTRRLSVSVLHHDGASSGTLVISPAPGAHFMRWRGHWLWITRHREKIETIGNGPPWRESFTIRMLARGQQALRDLLEEAHAQWRMPLDGKISIYSSATGHGWVEADRVAPRPLETVVLKDPDQLAALVQDAERFIATESWYREHGVPYRRGYLFSGSAGSGKSTTIKALAGALGRSIYILSLSGRWMDDGQLNVMMAAIPAKSLVVLEDVDCAFVERSPRADAAPGVTFSGLLNAIDGLAAREGRILLMTTNHPEKLDPALIRAGRVDVRVEFGPATANQIGRYYRTFHPDARAVEVDAFVASCPAGASMADIQAQLIVHQGGSSAPSAGARQLERAA